MAHRRQAGRRELAGLISLVLLLVVVPAASADSIAYVGQDGNVWLTTPDGARQVRLSSDGSPANPLRSPSQADDGTVVAARGTGRLLEIYNRDGSKRQTWQVQGITGASGPIVAQVNPSDSRGLIVFHYLEACVPACTLFPKVAFQDADAATAHCAFPCYDNFSDPRFIPGTARAGFVSGSGAEIQVQDPTQGSGRRAWLTSDPGQHARAFDVSRSGYRALIQGTFDNDLDSGTPEIPQLELFDNKGTAPPDLGPGATSVCTLAPFGTSVTKPHWSPDSQRFTWHDSQGVWVSPAPVSSGGTCQLSPTLIVPGGSAPDWGVADVPAAAGGPGAGPGSGGPAGGGNTGDTRDLTRPAMAAFAVVPSTFAAAARGASAVTAAATVGTRVSFRLTERARTTFTVQRPAAGRRVGRACVAPRRSNRTRRRCTRYLRVGSFARQGVPGLNRFRFTGRVAGRKLPARGYRLVAAARDAAGNVSRPVNRTFRIVRR